MKTWLSAHIFYFDEPDSLLLDCVRPLVRELEKRELIDSFFFIRYWEGGPHIRFRLHGNTAILETEVKPFVDARVNEYLSAYPSTALIDEEEAKERHTRLHQREYGVAAFSPLYPNNSLQYIAYTPENGRYGGPGGVAVAEAHFEISSRIAFSLLDQTLGRKGLRQGASLRFALALALSMGVRREDLQAYFMNYFYFWLRFNGASPEAVGDSFRRSFEDRKRDLVSYIGNALELLDDAPGFSNHDLLSRWISASQTAYRQLRELDARGELSIQIADALRSRLRGPVLQPEPPVHSPRHPTDEAIQGIVGSYLHMFHNRLGISTLEEAYSAFVISQTLALLREETDERPRSKEMEQRSCLLSR